MEKIDTYKTIAKPATGYFRDRGSKFPAFVYEVESEEDVQKILLKLRKEYHDARHHCYAYRLGADHKKWRANDDGEPSNSAGQPIYGQIRSHELTNILIVVIRYFGGTLLGVPGLINAYKTAAADAIDNGGITTKIVYDNIRVDFEYPAMNDVMKLIKESKIEQKNQIFELSCSISLRIRQSISDEIIIRLRKIKSVTKVELRSKTYFL